MSGFDDIRFEITPTLTKGAFYAADALTASGAIGRVANDNGSENGTTLSDLSD